MDKLEYRKEALEHMASLARLDQLIQITSPRLWVLMAALYGLIIAIVVWSFIGSIPTWVLGQGLLLPKEGSIYNAVAPSGEGRLAQILVMPGDQVKKGQIVANLNWPNLTAEVKISRDYLSKLTQDYQTMNTDAQAKIAVYKKHIADQDATLQTVLQTETANLANLLDLLKIKQISFKKGLETKENLVATWQQYYNTKQAIEQTKDRLTQNKISEANFVNDWTQRLHDLQLRVKDQQYKVDDAQSKLNLSKTVVSPIDGVVTAIQSSVGSVLRTGDTVLTVASIGQGMDAVIYAPAQEGKRIQPDMEALVSPGNIKKEEYGSIRGKVLSVSRFPISKISMQAVLQNENLVETFSREGAPIAVRIALTPDPKTFSKLAWTSSHGPHELITPGTPVTVRITVYKQRPISLVIPAFKKWLALD